MSVVTKAAAIAAAEVIRLEAATNGNTRTRVAQLYKDIIDSSLFGDGALLGYQPVYDGNNWVLAGPLPGTALTDADQTLAIASGAQWILPATVPLTANRIKALSLTGVSAGLAVAIISFGTRAFTMTVRDATTGGTVLFTFPASSTLMVANFRVNAGATAWELGTWFPLGAVVTP